MVAVNDFRGNNESPNKEASSLKIYSTHCLQAVNI